MPLPIALPRIMVAIDPGKGGGVALSKDGEVELSKFTTESEFLDIVSFMGSGDKSTRAIIEDVPPFVSAATSGASSFKLGYNYGFEVGAMRALRVPVELVKPRKWQAGLPGIKPKMLNRKRALVDVAKRLYPDLKVTRATADALLILNWYTEQFFN